MNIVETGWACPSCQVGEFWQWDEATETVKRGGRWCPHCGYGVHPPEPVKVA